MKTWVWLAVLFAILFVALSMLRSREMFSGPCKYSPAMPSTYLSGCSLACKAFPTLEEAQKACSAEPTCGGVTQRGGKSEFELRAGPETGPSPSGETSWVCTAPAPGEPVVEVSSTSPLSNTPAPVTPMSGTPAPVPSPQAPATIVLPFNTMPGTYLLRPVT